MLRDGYPAVELFALVPAWALEFEPVLARRDQPLDDATVFQAVKRDLARRRPHTPENGRPSTPVEVLRWRLIRRARPIVRERLAGVREAFRTRTRGSRRCARSRSAPKRPWHELPAMAS